MVRVPRMAFAACEPATGLAVDGLADLAETIHRTPANMLPEVATRTGSALLILWLLAGAIAAGQRHYYNGSDTNCVRTGYDRCDDYRGPAQLHRRESEDVMQHRSQANEAPTH
jgi:hypothetical protein